MTEETKSQQYRTWCEDGAHDWKDAEDPLRQVCSACPTWQWKPGCRPRELHAQVIALSAKLTEVQAERDGLIKLIVVNDAAMKDMQAERDKLNEELYKSWHFEGCKDRDIEMLSHAFRNVVVGICGLPSDWSGTVREGLNLLRVEADRINRLEASSRVPACPQCNSFEIRLSSTRADTTICKECDAMFTEPAHWQRVKGPA